MKGNKVWLFVLLVTATVILSACSPAIEDLANGQNYFCPGESYMDIVQLNPEPKFRFTCTDPGKEFEVVFSGPNDAKLIERIENVIPNFRTSLRDALMCFMITP